MLKSSVQFYIFKNNQQTVPQASCFPYHKASIKDLCVINKSPEIKLSLNAYMQGEKNPVDASLMRLFPDEAYMDIAT